MVRSNLREAITQLPTRIAERGHPYFRVDARAREDDSPYLFSEGYTMTFDLEEGSRFLGITTPGVLVTLSKPQRFLLENTPMAARLYELLSLSRATACDLGFTSRHLNRATNYMDRGIIQNPYETPMGGIGIPPEIEIFHRLRERKRHSPADLAEAVWVLSGKPLLWFAASYRGK